MITKIDMLEGEIVRAMKNKQFSPIQLTAARYFKDLPANIDVTYDSIVIWNDDINDYQSYKYCVEDIKTVRNFLDEWNDYADGQVEDFCLSPISFCVEKHVHEKKF